MKQKTDNVKKRAIELCTELHCAPMKINENFAMCREYTILYVLQPKKANKTFAMKKHREREKYSFYRGRLNCRIDDDAPEKISGSWPTLKEGSWIS